MSQNCIGILKTYPKLEKYCEIELERYCKNYKIEEIFDGCVVFSAQNFESFEKLAYFTQSSEHVSYLLAQKENDRWQKIQFFLLDILKKTGKTKYWIEISHDPSIPINEETYKRKIQECTALLDSDFILNPKDKDFTLTIFITKTKELLGLNILQGDLSKRSYKIYLLPNSIKGTLGFLLSAMCGICHNKPNSINKVLYLFSGDGILPIEFSLWTKGLSVRYYDKRVLKKSFLNISNHTFEDFDKEIASFVKSLNQNFEITSCDSELKHLTFAQRNAKLAGVEKDIIFRKISLDLLDLKFEENYFDAIVSFLLLFNNRTEEEKINKFYKYYFYQTEYILKKNKNTTILVRNAHLERIKEIAKEFNFSLERIEPIREDIAILLLKNNKK
ncbi:MAG: hypothetical protein QW524_00105 [Candidatus Woesearchaeota archaeon]